MGAGADLEHHVGLGQRQLGEEDVVQLHVVVLASVDEVLIDEASLRERRVDRRHLHVVGSCPDDVRDDLAHRPTRLRTSSRATSQVKRVLPTT